MYWTWTILCGIWIFCKLLLYDYTFACFKHLILQWCDHRTRMSLLVKLPRWEVPNESHGLILFLCVATTCCPAMYSTHIGAIQNWKWRIVNNKNKTCPWINHQNCRHFLFFSSLYTVPIVVKFKTMKDVIIF